MNVLIKVVDDKSCKRVFVETLEFGAVADVCGFDYEFPDILCSGRSLDQACSEATRQMDEYTRRGFVVDLQQDY